MSMQIRPATARDRAAIIGLLRESLGESTIPKSEALWSWKHEQNPFGASYALVAEENNMLTGVRVFMKWKWQWKQQVYNAIRAVDTATHPEHQGKGIFKKLTLKQVELCKQLGEHFVFNTPNEQSRPGYLKMGWMEQGKMPLKLKPAAPLSMGWSKLFAKNRFPESSEDPSPEQEWTPAIANLLQNYKQTSEQLSTILTPQYINWRYAHNPLFRYNYFTDNENYLLISRNKNHSFYRELRLVDFILLNPKADIGKINAQIRKKVLSFNRANKIGIISISGQQYQHYKGFFKWMGVVPVKQLGPIVTVRDMNMNEQFNDLLDYNNWNYSLGDMELF
jgi:predicted N-acetyltransferase YhbS